MHAQIKLFYYRNFFTTHSIPIPVEQWVSFRGDSVSSYVLFSFNLDDMSSLALTWIQCVRILADNVTFVS